MINGYIKQLTWSKFLGSAGKRIGNACVQMLPNAIISTLPLWLRIPITFATQTSGQYLGKAITLWAISPATTTKPPSEKEIYIEGFLVIDPDKEMKIQSLIDEFEIMDPSDDLMIINATLPDQSPNSEIVSYTSACKEYFIKISKSLTHSAMNYVVTTTGADIAEKTGATISSVLATTTFVMVMGPPSLLAMPLVFVFEGSAKSMGAYFTRQLYEHYSPALATLTVNGIDLAATALTERLHCYLDKPLPDPGLSLDELEDYFGKKLILTKEECKAALDQTEAEILHSNSERRPRNDF